MRDGRRAASAAGNHNTLPLLLLLLLALGASGNGVSAFLLRAQQSQHAAANLQGDAALNATNDSTPDLQKSSSIEAAGGEQSHACRVSANDVYATTAWKGIAPQNVCDQRNELFDCHDCLCDLWKPFAEAGIDPYTIDWKPKNPLDSEISACVMEVLPGLLSEKGMSLMNLLNVFSTCKESNPFKGVFPPACVLQVWDLNQVAAENNDVEMCMAKCADNDVAPAPENGESLEEVGPLTTRSASTPQDDAAVEAAAARAASSAGGMMGGGASSKIPDAFPLGYTDKIAAQLLVTSLAIAFLLTICRAVFSSIRVNLARRRCLQQVDEKESAEANVMMVDLTQSALTNGNDEPDAECVAVTEPSFAAMQATAAAPSSRKIVISSPPVDLLEFRNISVSASPAFGLDACRRMGPKSICCATAPPATDSPPNTARGEELSKSSKKARNLSTILEGVSGNLISGELTAILGQSGAGKSTMLRAIAQAPMPMGVEITGAVYVDGKLVLGRECDGYASDTDDDDVDYDDNDNNNNNNYNNEEEEEEEEENVGGMETTTQRSWPFASKSKRSEWTLPARRDSGTSTLSSDSSTSSSCRLSWWSRSRYLTHLVFMEQTDALLCPFLSARENVHLYVSLRSPHLTRSRASFVADAVLDDVGLKRAAWMRRVGSGMGADSNLSGGERRKTVLACQLAAEPSIVLADEPTSGLDALSAMDVVSCLRRYSEGESIWCTSQQRRIVALTIHQPSSALFDEFQRVFVVAEGRIAWTGTPRESVLLDVVRAGMAGDADVGDLDVCPEAEEEQEVEEAMHRPEAGDDCRASCEVISAATTPRGIVASLVGQAVATAPPPESAAIVEEARRKIHIEKKTAPVTQASPADVLVSLSHASLRAAAKRQNARAAAAAKAVAPVHDNGDNAAAAEDVLEWAPPPPALRRPVLSVSLWHLIVREFRSVLRRPALFATHLVAAAALGVMLGLVYFDVPATLPGVINRMGAFFFFASLWGFAGMSAIDPTFESRYRDQTGLLNLDFPVYSLLLARVLADSLLLRVIPTIIYGSIFYPLMGLRASTQSFFVFIGIGALYTTNMGILAMLVATLSPSMGVAIVVLAIVILFMVLFGGFLVNPASMPPITLALRQLSPFYQTFSSFLLNELKDNQMNFRLDVEMAGTWTSIEGVQGNTFLSVVGVDRKSSVLRHSTALWLHTIFLSLLLYLSLRFAFVPGRRWRRA